VVGEVLKLADVATMIRDLERLTTAENLLLADAVTAARDFDATLTEPVKLADVVTAIQDELVTVVDSLKISDTASGQVDPEQAAPSESLLIADAVTPNLASPTDLSSAVATELLTLSDPLTAAMGLTVVIGESIQIGEVIGVGDGSALAALLIETLKLADVQTASADLRVGPEQEDFSITDTVEATLALTLVIPSETVRGYDNDFLQVALDLAVEIPGPDVEPIGGLSFTQETLSSGMCTLEVLLGLTFENETLSPV